MKYIEAGFALRRQVRRFLMANKINFEEDKGWIDSVFYLDCSTAEYEELLRKLKQLQE